MEYSSTSKPSTYASALYAIPRKKNMCSSHPSILIPHPGRITPHLLHLPTNSPVPKPSLLPPPPTIPILFIKLPNGAQTAHILANARANLLHRLVEMSLMQRPLLRVFVLLLGRSRVRTVIFRMRGGGGSSSGVEFFAHASKSGCDADVLEVGAGVKGCLGGEVRGGDFGVEEFGLEVDLQDCFSVLFGWQIDEEAAR